MSSRIRTVVTLTALGLFIKPMTSHALDTHPSVVIDNSIGDCISIQKHEIQQVDNTSLLTIDYKPKQSIAHCGCKSALAQYRVLKPHQELATDLIDFRDKDEVAITLSHVPSLVKSKPLTVSFSCSQPL